LLQPKRTRTAGFFSKTKPKSKNKGEAQVVVGREKLAPSIHAALKATGEVPKLEDQTSPIKRRKRAGTRSSILLDDFGDDGVSIFKVNDVTKGRAIDEQKKIAAAAVVAEKPHSVAAEASTTSCDNLALMPTSETYVAPCRGAPRGTKVTVNGTQFTIPECAVKALEANENCAEAWAILGEHQKRLLVTVGGQDYTRRQCILKALSIDRTNARVWQLLGESMHAAELVEVGGAKLTRQQCLVYTP